MFKLLMRSCCVVALLCIVAAIGCGSGPSSSAASSAIPAVPTDVQQRSLSFRAANYTYYVYLPTSYDGRRQYPALLLAHGGGENGLEFLQFWKEFAEANSVVLVAPTLPYTAAFESLVPPLFVALMDQAQTEWRVDPTRLYVFGFSAGGYVTFDTAMFDSTYFAGAGVFAATITPPFEGILTQAERKTPIAMYMGDHDQFSTLAEARHTRDLLQEHNFPLHYVELRNQDHNFLAAAGFVEQDAWDYLSQFTLDSHADRAVRGR